MRRRHHLRRQLAVSIFAVAALELQVPKTAAQLGPAITVNSSLPKELNPPFNSGPPMTGGAAAATPAQAYAFAWQELGVAPLVRTDFSSG